MQRRIGGADSLLNFLTRTKLLLVLMAIIGLVGSVSAWANGAGGGAPQPLTDPQFLLQEYEKQFNQCMATANGLQKNTGEKDDEFKKRKDGARTACQTTYDVQKKPVKEAMLKAMSAAERIAAEQRSQQEQQRKEQMCENQLRDLRELEKDAGAGCIAFAGSADPQRCAELKNQCDKDILTQIIEDPESCEDIEPSQARCFNHPDFAKGTNTEQAMREARKELNEAQRDLQDMQRERVREEAEARKRIKEMRDQIKEETREYEEARSEIQKAAQERAEELDRKQQERFRDASQEVQKADAAIRAQEIQLADFDGMMATENKNRELRCRQVAQAFKTKFISSQRERQANTRRARGQYTLASQGAAMERLIERHAEVEKRGELERCLIGESEAGLEAMAKMNQLRAQRESAAMKIAEMRRDRAKMQQQILADLATIENEVRNGKNKVAEELLERLTRLDRNHQANMTKLNEEIALAQSEQMQLSGVQAQQSASYNESLVTAQSRLAMASRAQKCGGSLALKSESQQTTLIDRIAKGFEALERSKSLCSAFNTPGGGTTCGGSLPKICETGARTPAATGTTGGPTGRGENAEEG